MEYCIRLLISLTNEHQLHAGKPSDASTPLQETIEVGIPFADSNSCACATPVVNPIIEIINTITKRVLACMIYFFIIAIISYKCRVPNTYEHN